jgi:hypothetical protein
MAISKRIFGSKPNASLDSLKFETVGYEFQGEADNRRTWFTPDGDGVGLFLFLKPPDLPTDAQTSAELQEFYRGRIGNDQVKIVEFRLQSVAGVNCVWMLLKIPRQPHGMDYLGALTNPFAEFSFVIKMQCEERGITGVREAALFLRSQQDGSVTLTPGGQLAGDWNPDDERHDSMFPDHPVSRLRRNFGRIIETLQIHEATKTEPRFELPASAA